MRPKKHSHDKCDFLTSRAKGVIDDPDALFGKHIYLDVENRKIGEFMGDVLKQLGAVVCYLPENEVDLVITDRKEWVANGSGADNLSCHITSDTSSFQLCPKTSECNSLEVKEEWHAKSHGGEMLHGANRRSFDDDVDPLDIAARNGIPILGLSDAENLVNNFWEAGAGAFGVKPLKAPFIKLDLRRGNYQPCFKEFVGNWPAVRISGSGVPFLSPSKSTHSDIRPAGVKDKVTKRAFLEEKNNFEKILRLNEENRLTAKKCASKSVLKEEIFPSGCTENTNVISGNKLYLETKATVSSAKCIAQIPCSCDKCRIPELLVSQWSARLCLYDDLKYESLLSFLLHERLSGNVLVWLPKDGIRESGRIHVALTNSECDLPVEIATPKETKAFTLPLHQACSKNIYAVTRESGVWITLDKSENLYEHLSGFAEATHHCNFTVTGTNDVLIGINDFVCESPTYVFYVIISSGGTDSSRNGKILIQLALPDDSAQTSFALKITTGSIKKYSCSDNQILFPVVDVGLLEIVVYQLLSSVILEQTKQCEIWRVSQELVDSGETELENKPKWANFELVLPKTNGHDALVNFVAEACDDFVKKGKLTNISECGSCAEFELTYPVKLYRHCGKICRVDDPFKKPEVFPTKSETSDSRQFPTSQCNSTFLVDGKRQNIKKLNYDPEPVGSNSRREQLLETKESKRVQKQSRQYGQVMRNNNFLKCDKVSRKKTLRPKPVRKLHETTDFSVISIYKSVGPGFCQICCCSYKSLAEHLNEQSHVDFVANSANFMELDRTIHDISRSSIFDQRLEKQ